MLGPVGREAQSIIKVKREQATNEEKRKKKESNARAKKGSNNDKPNKNGVSVLDVNLCQAHEPAEAWLVVCVMALW